MPAGRSGRRNRFCGSAAPARRRGCAFTKPLLAARCARANGGCAADGQGRRALSAPPVSRAALPDVRPACCRAAARAGAVPAPSGGAAPARSGQPVRDHHAGAESGRARRDARGAGAGAPHCSRSARLRVAGRSLGPTGALAAGRRRRCAGCSRGGAVRRRRTHRRQPGMRRGRPPRCHRGGAMMPASAQTRSRLADGTLLTITATRRERANRADIKTSVPGAPALAERLLQVLRLARHTEPRFDSRDQVVLSFDRAPGAVERDWELAAVLADRMVRGVWQPLAPVLANGWSDQWQLGRIGGHQSPGEDGDILLGGPGQLAHLGMLTGRPDQGAAVSSARCWFPLHSGAIERIDAHLDPAQAVVEEEDSIAVPGLDMLGQAAVRQALAASRLFDARGTGRWRSVVRFGAARFQGSSAELALVMADRIARGREFLPRGRIIATGASSDWQAGRVDAVDAREPKLALMLAQAVAGDRLLVPAAWEAELPADFVEALAARGASIACVSRIGII